MKADKSQRDPEGVVERHRDDLPRKREIDQVQPVMEYHFTGGQYVEDCRAGVIESNPGVVTHPKRKILGTLDQYRVGCKIASFIGHCVDGAEVGQQEERYGDHTSRID